MSNTAIDWLILASGLQRRVDPQVLRLRVRLDEQRAAALAVERPHHLPGVVLVLLRVGADQRDRLVAEVAGRPDRAELRDATKLAPRPGCGILPTSTSAASLSVLGVDHRDLVRRVGRDQEVAAGRVEAAVVQEARRVDLGDLQVLEVL